MVVESLQQDRAEVIEAIVQPVSVARPLVTVEKALYGALVLVAAILRFVQLGISPMTAGEAGQAFAAYRLASGAGLPSETYSPLLFTLNFITFALIGSGDVLARVFPALAGSAIVAVPYWLRRWLGRPGGLATATLLAVSPSWVLFSRQADEGVITALFTLAAFTIALRFLMTPIPRRLMWLGVWTAVALASGRGAWLFVLLAVAFVLAITLSNRDSVTREDILAAVRAIRADRGSLVTTLLLSLALFFTLSTAVFFNPGGLQAALDSLAAWTRPPITSVSGGTYLLSLGVYETMIFILAVVGGGWLLYQRNLLALFLMSWFAVGLIVSELSPARPPSGIVTILLPLTLLAGMVLGRLVDELREHASWDREGLILLVATPFIIGPLLQLANFATQASTAPGQGTRLALILALFVVFIGAILSAVAAMVGREVAARGAALLGLVLLGLLTIRSTALVTYPQAYVPQEFLAGPLTSADATRMADQVYVVAHDRFGASRMQAVALDQRLTPTLEWYLRFFPAIDLRNNVAGSTAAHLIAAVPSGAEPPTPPTGYVGQPGRFESRFDPRGLDARGWLRWYLYRDAPSQPAVVDGFVWFARPIAPQPGQ